MQEDMVKEKVKNTVSAEIGLMEKRGYLMSKRVFDVVVSLFGMLVLLIPMLLLAVLIRLESEGPAFFVQNRMGQNGEVFSMYKLRTMKTTAPAELASREFAEADQYITRLGRFLRRTSVDELPQLYNVLRGDMSIVGYRPVCLSEERLNDLRKQTGVMTMRPGITGLAQVCGRDSVGVEDKVAMDLQYVESCGWRMDLWCLKETVLTVVSGKGVN